MSQQPLHSSRERIILPPAALRETDDEPEVHTSHETVTAVAPGDGEEVTIPPDIPELPSLSGYLGDHILIDDPPPSPPPPKIYHTYPRRKSIFTGIAQIVLGLIAIACQSVLVAYSEPAVFDYDAYNYFGTGYVCGSFFLATGVVSLLTIRRKTKKWICCIMAMSFVACLFAVLLAVVSAIGLRQADASGRYLSTCQVETFKGLSSKIRQRKSCRGLPPMLTADITCIIVSVLQFVTSVTMGIQCYHLIIKKKRDQLQYVRTPEGILMVLNKGPDYSNHLSSTHTANLFIRTDAGEILYPVQAGAVLKPPPYPADDSGKPLDPPVYQAQPPSYFRQAMEPLSGTEETDQQSNLSVINPAYDPGDVSAADTTQEAGLHSDNKQETNTDSPSDASTEPKNQSIDADDIILASRGTSSDGVNSENRSHDTLMDSTGSNSSIASVSSSAQYPHIIVSNEEHSEDFSYHSDIGHRI